ncbi:RNA-directed DNA polymerase, eukaryota [Tanacetum coccineum]
MSNTWLSFDFSHGIIVEGSPLACKTTREAYANIYGPTVVDKIHIGIKGGCISAIGKAGNPDAMNGVFSNMINGVRIEIDQKFPGDMSPGILSLDFDQKIPGDMSPGKLLIDAYTFLMFPRVPVAFQSRACSLHTLHFLKVLENNLEVLKVLENNLESLKVLKNKLESLKLHENRPVDGLVPLSI